MKDKKQNLVIAEEFLKCAKDDLFVARTMRIFRKKNIEIYHIEQAIEKLQRAVYSMYGIPYVGETKKHVPSKLYKYTDNLVNIIEQEENKILTREQINKSDIITYSKNYSKLVEEIDTNIQNQKKVNDINVSELKKVTTNLFISKIIINTILSGLFDVEILDKNNVIIDFSDEDRLKLINAEKSEIQKAFLAIDMIPYTISDTVVKRHKEKGAQLNVPSKDLQHPDKMIFKYGKGLFDIGDTFLLGTSHTTCSLAELTFLHYLTYPHMNPTRYPTKILQTEILTSDYSKDKFAITDVSSELIKRTNKNLITYTDHLKSLKDWYYFGIIK